MTVMTLIGGPFDGLDVEWEGESFLYVNAGNSQVAMYEIDHRCELMFTKIEPMGEGCMPHISPNNGQAQFWHGN